MFRPWREHAVARNVVSQTLMSGGTKKESGPQRAAFPIRGLVDLSAKVIVHDRCGINAQVIQHTGNSL
jgi:hypothetical protein